MRHLLSLVLVALVCHLPARAAEPETFDRWFVLTLQGQRAGWAHMTQTALEGGDIETGSEMRLSVKRGPVAIEVEQSQTFRETADGKPVSAVSRMKLANMAMEGDYRFTDAGIESTTTQGGQKKSVTLPPIAGAWLAPAAAQRHIEERLAAGEKEIRVRTLDLSMGVKPVEATMRLVGEENIEVLGRTVPAVVWDAQVSAMADVKMREYVDRDGRSLKTTVSVMPGMDMEMIAADEQLAKSELDPPELLASLMINPGEGSVAVEDPRVLTSAVYEVTVKPGREEQKVELPRAGYQRVVWGDDRTARVVVDVNDPVAPEDDLPTADHLASSMVINHEDEAVRELAGRAIPENVRLTRQGQAEALRTFVHDYLNEKSLAVGFGTASEVARTREGDCSEHAVLLAALLRAQGIPSRVASGLLYVDEFLGHRNALGGHMWTQAWIEDQAGGRWVDLDAVLPDPPVNGIDAGRITLAVSTLSDDKLTNELVELAPLLGMLEVKVISAEGAAVAATP